VQIGKQIVELLPGEGTADGRHHVAASDDGLAHKSFVGRQAARQERFFEQPLKAGAILSGN